MGAKYVKKNDPIKNCLSRSELRAVRGKQQKASKSFFVTKEDEKVQKLEDEQNDFAKLAENDPVEILMKDVEIKKPENEVTTDEQICKDYIDGATVAEIVKKFGLTQYKVRAILKKHDVKMRPKGFRKQDIQIIKEPEAKSCEVKEEITIEEPQEVAKIEVTSESLDDNILPANNFMFAEGEFSSPSLKRLDFSANEDIFVCGLVKDRHDIPFVEKYVFETLTQSNFNTPEYCENKARGFINAYLQPTKTPDRHKTMVVYCTGLQLALSALVSVCAQMQVNLITMHLNIDLKKYVPQKTLCIFGDNIPDLKDIENLNSNPLKVLSEKYDKIFTYGCDVQDLIDQERCGYIKASYGEKDNPDRTTTLILYNKEFPEENEWEFFGELIRTMQRSELRDRRHVVVIGRISIFIDNYRFGDVIAKSFNFKNQLIK